MPAVFKGGVTPAQKPASKQAIISQDPLRPDNVIPDALPLLPAQVESPFQRLKATANTLNKTSDELGGFVLRLDAIFKKLNLGVSAWVDVSFEIDEDGNFDREELGYTRVGQRWGISLRTTEGTQGEHPDNFSRGFWSFNDAPRELRIRSVQKIPVLIIALDKAAQKMITELSEKAAEVETLTSALEVEMGGAK